MPQEFIVQGRIVAGHPAKMRDKKDARTKQTIMKDGVPVKQIYFALAVEKNYFNAQILPLLQAEARTAFPNGTPPVFSWKYKDGDTVDGSGKPYALREGYAGHCVINFTTEGFAPQLFKQEMGANGTPVFKQLTADDIKCGYHCAVRVSIKFNGAFSPNTPGIYVNPNMVLLTKYDDEIVSSGQDPDEAFAGISAILPSSPHAAFTPQAYVAPAAVGAPAAYVAPVAAPAPQAYVPPVAMPAPAPDFVQNVIGVPPAPPMVPSAPTPFPPAGWTAHPASPGYYYMGQEVLTEQQLRERAAVPGMPAPR